MKNFSQTKQYKTLALDPPWPYTLRKNDRTHRNRIQYEPMAIADILKLPVPKLLDPDGAVVWLWYTNNHAIEAGKCVQAWGLELKTILTWEKVSKAGNTRIGTGHWLRNSTEHCYLCTYGKPKSFAYTKKLTNQPTIIKAERREHSRKPEEFFTLVNSLCDSPKLEMFARQRRSGWDAWGDQLELFDAV